MEPVLLVPPAGRVIAEDPAGPGVLVVAGEQRHDHEALHGCAEIPPDHGGQPVGLALQGQRPALQLLVVLELDLEQPDQLDADAGHPGDPHAGELVAAEHLLDVTLRDHVPGHGPAVARHHDAALAPGGHDRGAVRQAGRRPAGRRARRPVTRQHARRVAGQEVGER